MRTRRVLALIFALCIYSQDAPAAEPVIRNLDVRGLQVGGTTTIVLDGENLGAAPRLLLGIPAQQTLKPGGSANRATFDVTLAGQPPTGFYPLRVLAEGGVSKPEIIAVDALPQRPMPVRPQPPTKEAPAEKLPIAWHGVVSGSGSVEAKFAGATGQRVVVEVDAQRMGSKLRPVVHLVGPSGLQIAWAWGTPALQGDTRIEALLPEAGDYTVSVHDAEYGPPGPAFFRLRVGQWSYVDQVFPSAVSRGQSAAVDLLGAAGLARLNLPAADGLAMPLDLPLGTWVGPRPFVRVSSHPELAEQPGGVRELPSGPCGAHGRLDKPYEEDRFRLPVTPGGKLRLEVFAERAGSPIDAALVVRNEKGEQLVRQEDGPVTLDPVLEYAVPAGVTAVLLGVVDAQGRGGPRAVYRLSVEPDMPRPADFRLWTNAQAESIPQGGRRVIPVFIDRQSYAGAVQLSAALLPPMIKLEGNSIPDGSEGALVTLSNTAAVSASTKPFSATAAITSWTGRGADGQQRTMQVKGHPLEVLQPWLASELAVAEAASEPAGFVVEWREPAADVGLVPAGKLPLTVKVARPALPEPTPDPKKPSDPKKPDPKAPPPKPTPDLRTVRLSLLTSQQPQLVNGQVDVNRTVRLEKPIELAAADKEGTVTLLLPAELPGSLYDVTVQADLLAANKQTVLATSFTPVRRLLVRIPVVVQLAGPAKIEATLDAKTGATVKLVGKIERREGLKGDVTVTLTGLSPGIAAAPATVKADASDFTINIVLPVNQPPGETKGLKLSASAAVEGQPNVRVKSRDVELVIIVKPAPPEKEKAKAASKKP